MRSVTVVEVEGRRLRMWRPVGIVFLIQTGLIFAFLIQNMTPEIHVVSVLACLFLSMVPNWMVLGMCVMLLHTFADESDRPMKWIMDSTEAMNDWMDHDLEVLPFYFLARVPLTRKSVLFMLAVLVYPLSCVLIVIAMMGKSLLAALRR